MHTVAAATLAQEACALHPRLRPDLLRCAAILHDAGKVREFSLEGAEISLSAEGELVGHLALGQELVVERAAHLPSFRREKLQAAGRANRIARAAKSLARDSLATLSVPPRPL